MLKETVSERLKMLALPSFRMGKLLFLTKPYHFLNQTTGIEESFHPQNTCCGAQVTESF
jgi:hypothetical protein